jgi:hypothetical protein
LPQTDRLLKNFDRNWRDRLFFEKLNNLRQFSGGMFIASFPAAFT